MKTEAQILADLQKVAMSAKAYGAPPGRTRNAAEAALEGPSTVMTFPKKVTLTLQDYTRIVFDPGSQPVPDNLSESEKEYLVLCGAKPYAPGKSDLSSVNAVAPDPAKVKEAIEYVMDEAKCDEAEAKKIVDEHGAAVILVTKALDAKRREAWEAKQEERRKEYEAQQAAAPMPMPAENTSDAVPTPAVPASDQAKAGKGKKGNGAPPSS